MAEINQPAGTWTFDGDCVRIVPGSGKSVHPLRRELGEVAVPLEAVAGIFWEAGRKDGRLRLRLRTGADPLAQVAGGRLPDAADPYQLPVANDRAGVAEYFVDEVRHARLLDEVPDEPCDRYLLPGPPVPRTAPGTDGTAIFDGERVQLEWNWMTQEGKATSGPRTLPLGDIAAVEWTPAVGWQNGSLRFRPHGTHPTLKAEHDPNCVLLWGVRQARETSGAVLLATAVTVRLPHPARGGSSPAALAQGPDTGPEPVRLDKAPVPRETSDRTGDSGADHDALLRRLRELGELHSAGILTDEEFTAAKQAILNRF